RGRTASSTPTRTSAPPCTSSPPWTIFGPRDRSGNPPLSTGDGQQPSLDDLFTGVTFGRERDPRFASLPFHGQETSAGHTHHRVPTHRNLVVPTSAKCRFVPCPPSGKIEMAQPLAVNADPAPDGGPAEVPAPSVGASATVGAEPTNSIPTPGEPPA